MPTNFDNSSTWNYKVRHVQERASGVDYSGGNFVRGASVLIAAGPRKAVPLVLTNIFPIGVLQTGSISQQKQLEEIFEIGSERRYFIPGRTFFQMQAQRIMIDGPSLLRAMYYRDSTQFTADTGITIPVGDEPGPSSGSFYTNLASIYFNTPTGLLVVDNNSDDQIVGGVYLEDCYIQSYNRQISAPQTVIAEQAMIRFDKIVPLSATTIQSITGGNAIAAPQT